MKNTNRVLVDIEEFTENANDYYERAKSGEKIIVTVEGAEKYEVFTDIANASNVLSEMPRPAFSQTEYDNLIDLLDPLDYQN